MSGTSPTIALARKELFHLWPLPLAFIVLEAFALTEAFLARSPDTLTWAEMSMLHDVSQGSPAATMGCLFGLATGYLLFPHEQDNGTLRLLWALPLTRWRIFATKIATGFSMLALLSSLSHLDSLWVLSLGANSITDSQFRWDYWWLELALMVGVYGIAIAYGVLISWFRWIGILFFLSLWAVSAFLGEANPALSYLNPISLLDIEMQGDGIQINSQPWIVQGSLAGAAVLLAGLLWTRHGERAIEPGETTSRLTSIGLVAGATLIALTYAAGIIAPGLGTGPDIPQRPESLQSKYYELTYYKADEQRAALLHLEADDFYRKVQALIGAPETGERIVVDLTDPGNNHLGIAGWKRMRVARESLYKPDERSHVFVHETAHVLADIAARGRLTDHAAYTGFFNEGYAEWISYNVLDLPEQRDALRILAAAAWRRHDLRFTDFLAASSFRAQYDSRLIYALGEAWVTALERACGREAPAEVLRVMGTDDAPQRLQGYRFWQANLQRANCSLVQVNTAMEELLDGYATVADAIPEVRARVRRVGPGQLEFRVQLVDVSPDQRFRVVVSARDNPQAPDVAVAWRSEWISGSDAPVTIELQAQLAGSHFQYQTGIYFLEGERPFNSRWISTQ